MSEIDPPVPPGDRFTSYLHWVFGGLAAVAIFALAGITFVDVWARYVFNAPIPGAYEVSELIMGVMIFSALPVVTWRGRHINIDLLDQVTPGWLTRWRDSFVHLKTGFGGTHGSIRPKITSAT